ncbi:NADP-dependent oxidoreductase [Salimicrobium flavidum]|uniref:NADPH:quinone reductase n=1 Tax=Salimicrobium flavidum TaxID=570947 RepID=A0A1N7KFN8_9BACI|nr:NADP-dependent oxidoreductase [Salimicrobium flavidum]SIS60284.1 NADPH:quinone reductase [Salimicrobium flavidum]
MKAIVINEYGHKEQLTEQEIETPKPGKGEVLVQVKATSINPIDWKLREGYLQQMLDFEFPIILGWDVAGIVEETGEGVTSYEKGDRVFSRPDLTRKGTYAEYTVVAEHLLAPLPENVTFEEGAATPLVGLTAWQCLTDVTKVQKGEKVLIQAGAGGVGSFAIQFAKEKGAYVATTGSTRNVNFLKSLGADEVIDYTEQDFAEVLNDYDVVFDTLGGDILDKAFDVLKDGGRLVTIAGQPDEEKAKAKNIEATSFWLEPDGDQLKEIADLMESGKVKAHIGHRYPLTAQGLQDAHGLSETHHAKGKIVINVE